MIGDSLSADMAGGIAFGLDTCWYNPQRLARPAEMPITHEIHTLSELVTWLGLNDSLTGQKPITC